MPGRQWNAGSGYRYGFNGKENDNEVKGEGNQHDYGMRIYDSRLSRFLSVDPLTTDFPELTPYQFASNTPIKATDIDGLESSWVPPGQTIRYDQIRSRPDALNQTATVQLNAQQQQQIAAINQRAQAAALSKPKSVLSSTDTSPGAKMRSEGFRQQAAQAKKVGQAMQTPEGQAGMGLAGIMHSTARTPVTAAEHGYGIYEGFQDRNGWQVAGNTVGLGLTIAPFVFKGPGAVTTMEEGIAYRAINPAFAESTIKNGFYRSGAAGRLGNDGIYANTTMEGAIAEFSHHNPGIKPAIFEVRYPKSTVLEIDPPPSSYYENPLPFTQGANILKAPSVRAPGTTNLLIRQGATPGARIQ